VLFEPNHNNNNNRDALSLQTNDDLKAWCECAHNILVYDGHQSFFVRREAWAQFVKLHRHVCWITYAIEYEYNVLWKHFATLGDEESEQIWTELMSNGQMKDILIIDALIRLALADEDTAYPPVKDILARYGETDLPEVLPGKLFYGMGRYYSI
jgi:hypothetical protein